MLTGFVPTHIALVLDDCLRQLIYVSGHLTTFFYVFLRLAFALWPFHLLSSTITTTDGMGWDRQTLPDVEDLLEAFSAFIFVLK